LLWDAGTVNWCYADAASRVVRVSLGPTVLFVGYCAWHRCYCRCCFRHQCSVLCDHIYILLFALLVQGPPLLAPHHMEDYFAAYLAYWDTMQAFDSECESLLARARARLPALRARRVGPCSHVCVRECQMVNACAGVRAASVCTDAHRGRGLPPSLGRRSRRVIVPPLTPTHPPPTVVPLRVLHPCLTPVLCLRCVRLRAAPPPLALPPCAHAGRWSSACGLGTPWCSTTAACCTGGPRLRGPSPPPTECCTGATSTSTSLGRGAYHGASVCMRCLPAPPAPSSTTFECVSWAGCRPLAVRRGCPSPHVQDAPLFGSHVCMCARVPR
jgi:hypothetical protein